MKTASFVPLIVFLASLRDTHAHALLTKPISKQGADENSYKLAPGKNFALASWWLDRAHFDNEPSKTPFTRPGEFSYRDARTCCGVNQVFHPCGCRVGSDISTCAGVSQARGFGELMGHSAITPEKVSMGGKLKTKFNMHANHAGGYTYSLCPKTEYDRCFNVHKPKSGPVDALATLAYLECVWTCFQANPLPFVGDQLLQLRGTEANHVTMKAVTKTGKSGKITATYREVPIADVGSNSNSWQYVKSFSDASVKAQFTADFGPQVPKGTVQTGVKGHNPTEWQVVDEVQIPAPTGSLKAGQYVLSWRYDCGTANQIWSNCADVELVGGPVPTPDPSATTVATTKATTKAPTGSTTANTGSKEHAMCEQCAVGSMGHCKGGASGDGCWAYSDPANKLCPPGTKPCFKTSSNTANKPVTTSKGTSGPCTDTPNWHNDFARPLSCAEYVAKSYCNPKTKSAGFAAEWTMGSHYKHPERNCCACGKGTSYEKTVENLETDGLLERGNRDTIMGNQNPSTTKDANNPTTKDTGNPTTGKVKGGVDGSARVIISLSLCFVGTLSAFLF